ncbi:MAG: DUF222 domain-containing protein [Mycetocola sp.]
MEDLHEPPDPAIDRAEYDPARTDESEPVEPPLSGLRAEACSAIVGEVATVARTEAKLKAWQLELIDEAVRLAEATERGVLTLGSTLTATQRREMARRSVVAELACELRMPEVTVSGMVGDADALLHKLPATMTALRAGNISYRHAKVMVDQSTTLPPEAALALETLALPFAQTLTVSKFAAKTRLLREHLDPDSIIDRVSRSAKDRRLDFQPAPDGMAWLSLYTTAPEANSIFTAVRDRAVALRKKPNEPRTLTQLAADVCTDALSAALSGELPVPAAAPVDETTPADGTGAPASTSASTSNSGPTDGGRTANSSTAGDPAPASDGLGADPGSAFRRIRPTVTVTVPALTLLGLSDEPATLEGYGPIDPETARVLAGKSKTWYRMLTDPKTGAPVAVDTTKYRPTKAMRRYLEYVDGTCRFEGCNRAARHCDLDHTKDHQFNGPTQCENLSHLCPKHHRLKHQTTWRAKQLGNGSLGWTSPGGRTYVTQPAVLLAIPETEPRTHPPKAPPTERTQAQPRKALPPPNPNDPPPF